MEQKGRIRNAGKAASVKKRIFEIIQIGSRTDIPSTCFDVFIIFVILINISVTVLQTFDEAAGYSGIIGAAELITMVIFLAEYILRLWTADCLYPEKPYPAAVFRFIISFYGVVDLLTILPYFCPFFIPSGAVVFRMLRVERI